MNAQDPNSTMAVFLDLENIALGTRDAHYPRFDIRKVLERLLLKGHIVVKKAYCDFDRFKEFKRDLHEAAFGSSRFPTSAVRRNSADITWSLRARPATRAVDTFVFIGGDSVYCARQQLRENAKKVIGAGSELVRSSSAT